ncbi:unnamed protein product [Didymodactylos carnosus]|uniref:Uncharacterized protein n=1 Tax=Didymodactylos carnosus TaxID=1234261 RepID=A0A815PHK8_9BILA|nr:unnamed protein product [Didymodactylos carnosus]CAF1561221.1 unnamed protein product [Didymodactylos carnosus]CAF4322867.1 unnamed protein product [Didymodactylos carnosus]CAF4352982.1 unnamed protein product [Didymodactylos carnosus]
MANIILSAAAALLLAVIVTSSAKMSAYDLGRCIMSEGSIGYLAEKTALAFVCQRNSKHARNQEPSTAVLNLAKRVLAGKIPDLTKGASHWYSPRSMPSSAQKSKCSPPIGTGNMDCRGGLESVCSPSVKSYKPSWATRGYIEISGVRPCYFKFHKL